MCLLKKITFKIIFQMKLLSTTLNLVSSLTQPNKTQRKGLKYHPWLSCGTGVRTADTHGNWLFKARKEQKKGLHLPFLKEKDTNSGHVQPMLKSTCVSCFCFSSRPSCSFWGPLPGDEPSDQRADLRRGHPGRGQRGLLAAVAPTTPQVPPRSDHSLRCLEPQL